MKQNEDKAASPVLWLQAAEDSGANFGNLSLAPEPGSGPVEVSEAGRGNPRGKGWNPRQGRAKRWKPASRTAAGGQDC